MKNPLLAQGAFVSGKMKTEHRTYTAIVSPNQSKRHLFAEVAQ
jgi:hypothetical protein